MPTTVATPEQKRRWARTKKSKLRKWINEIKLRDGCVDCGYKEAAVALDFDHLYDDKFLSIGFMISCGYGRPSILREIEKCEIVCANCHRVRTMNRRQETTL